jgi:glycosyltransferase involved in cell wall biosynthesis
MDKYDFIGVKEQGIYGINNPQLIIKSTINFKKFEIQLFFDDKKIDDYDCIFLGDNKTFLLKSRIPISCKRIKVYIKHNNDVYKICDLKNSLFIRIKHKIVGDFKKIFSKIKIFFHVIYKGFRFLWREYHFLVPPRMLKKYFHDFKVSMKSGDLRFYDPFDRIEYNKWLKKNKVDVIVDKMEYNPLISLLIPVYNIKSEFLKECLDSILEQSYKNFEICLVDDCSTLQETKDVLKEYSMKDNRIKVKYRSKNGHISQTTNDALKMAKGEFVGLIDDDDLLDKNALYEVVRVLNHDKTIDFIYSDEDKISPNGTFCDPHFKPDWSPDTLLSLNYICHFTVIRKKLINEVGGFAVGLEGSQDYDLFLKVTEKTNNIFHISKILYHWRMVEGSTSMTINNKSYAIDKGKIAIENALKRRKIEGHVEKDEISTYYQVVYEYSKEPLISIIIPTRDYVDILKKCVDSIYEKTEYKNFEIIIANNDSKEAETLNFFEKYKKKYNNFKVVNCIMDFNYSKINNVAISKSKGEYIVLLNNDTEIITPRWLNIMVGYAMQKHVGTVGVKLLYPDDLTVQHGGVILGLGGVASHAYTGEDRTFLGMYGRLRVPYNYAANTAACLMVSRQKFNEVEGLEENLMVAYNDVDFNIKLLKKGYFNVFLPQVEVIHYESKSRGLDTTSSKYKRFLYESQYMWDKWEEILNNDPFYNSNFAKSMWFKLNK